MSENNWKHVDLWRRRGNGFSVEISRHEAEASAWDHGTGQHRWCVYAYVYPSHPHFAAFEDNDKMWQSAAVALPLHAYPSYLQAFRLKDGSIGSWKVGSDYNHLHDARFTFSPVMPPEVQADAEELFAWLEQRAVQQTSEVSP